MFPLAPRPCFAKITGFWSSIGKSDDVVHGCPQLNARPDARTRVAAGHIPEFLWQMGSICFRSMGKLNRRAKLCKRQRRRHLLTIEHQLNVRRRTEKTVEDGSPFVGLR